MLIFRTPTPKSLGVQVYATVKGKKNCKCMNIRNKAASNKGKHVYFCIENRNNRDNFKKPIQDSEAQPARFSVQKEDVLVNLGPWLP